MWLKVFPEKAVIFSTAAAGRPLRYEVQCAGAFPDQCHETLTEIRLKNIPCKDKVKEQMTSNANDGYSISLLNISKTCPCFRTCIFSIKRGSVVAPVTSSD